MLTTYQILLHLCVFHDFVASSVFQFLIKKLYWWDYGICDDLLCGETIKFVGSI